MSGMAKNSSINGDVDGNPINSPSRLLTWKVRQFVTV